jgi:DnaK suppressor protein
MNPARVGILRDKLQKRKHQVALTLQHLEKEQEQADENNDWLDEATFRSRVRLLDRLTDWYVAESAQIERALIRLDTQSYGLCRACHQNIELARLEAFPEAEFCVACQDMREKVEHV